MSIPPRSNAPLSLNRRDQACAVNLNVHFRDKSSLATQRSTRSKPIRIYQVVRRGAMWHVHMPDASAGVQPCADKPDIVTWACETARSNRGTVYVRDIGGAIETIYSYVDGVEHVQRILAVTR